MGNSPSTSKPTTPSSSHAHSLSHGSDSPKPAKRDSKHPIPVHNHRVAAPPEPSLAQAQGSTSINRGKSLHPRPVASLNSSSPSSSTSSSLQPSKPLDLRAKSDVRHEPTKPVAVPNSHQDSASPHSPFADALEAAAMPHSSIQDMSYLTRPPRLPLPIEEEVHTPGSPILSPADIAEPVGDVDALDSEAVTRKSSTLSTTTLDDEDAEELRVDKTRPTVPTRLEWLRGGEKVYVTGTIFQWNRKTRLHPVEGRPGVFAATINILPGTHHVRFLVDGQMQTSPDLPTTVDFGNNLVNYIEVSPDDVAPELPETSGVPIPGDEAQQPVMAGPAPAKAEEEKGRPQKGKAIRPRRHFSHHIPKYLVDFDQPEDSPHYNKAVTAIEKLPTPPSLPGFLGKPILNAAVLIKDDNSVLNMPNHTVLNHLATSSIKNNILAVSATTRYKHKYVTTIVYKPTSTED